jgi:hypothetical protein
MIFYDDDVLHPASLTDSEPGAKVNVAARLRAGKRSSKIVRWGAVAR